MKEKKCNKCGETKLLRYFYKMRHPRKPEYPNRYYRSYCKSCTNESNKKAIKKYIAKYPVKTEARLKLTKAIKSGFLKRKPCIVCGNEKVDGHHYDYKKPLDVIWLCRVHHNDIHHGRLLIKI